jgi:polyadenylate-binding protein
MAATTQQTTSSASNFVNASLYVGDLHLDVNEATLMQLFKDHHVDSIHVCRDALTRKSLGYAYVNFRSLEDAEHALDALNGALINDRPCRIMKSQRDPSSRRSHVGNVFIKNLETTISNKELLDTFSAFGQILSAKVVTDETGASKGYGFVHFETQKSAEDAIEKLNGKLFNGITVHIGHFIPKRERMAQSNARYTNVYVKNLGDDVTEDMIKDELLKGQFGNVNSCIIMRDGAKSKGFGFVNFDDHEAALKSVEVLNNTEFRGKTVFVGRAMKKSERQALLRDKYQAMRNERDSKFQGVNLYVKNLTDDVDDERCRTEFAPFGNITSVKVMRDERGVSRGFGFVCYTTSEEAMRAVHDMNGRLLNGKPLFVAIAQRKEDRRRQLQMHFETGRRPLAPGAAQAPMMQPAMYTGMYPQYPAMQRYPTMAYPMSSQAPQGRWIQPQYRPTQQQQPRDQDKTQLGMKLFEKVQRRDSERAPKITGMLIELDAVEINKLLEDDAALDAKINEAITVLNEAAKKR